MAIATGLVGRFSQKAFIVTGGFFGIGLATVQQLIRGSATIHVVDRSSKPPSSLLKGTGKDFPASGGQVYFYHSVDVSSREPVHNTFAEILSKSPQIDGLVNSAGIWPSSGGILENDETFQSTIAVNLFGTWNVGTELLRHILDKNKTSGSPEFQGWTPGQGSVSIVNIGSFASYHGFPTFSAYTASKHAVLDLTRTWTLDFAPHGTRVNLVTPGGTKTPLSAAQFDDKERGDMPREVYPLIPMKQFGDLEELADSIVYLLSDQSSYITGQILKVNGGRP